MSNEKVDNLEVQSENVSAQVKENNPYKIEVGDYVSIRYKENDYDRGKVVEMNEINGATELTVKSGDNYSKVKANAKDIRPMYFTTKEDKKVSIFFDYREIMDIAKSGKFGKTFDYNALKSNKLTTSLAKGDATKAVQTTYQKTQDNVTQNYDMNVRFQLYRSSAGDAKLKVIKGNRQAKEVTQVFGSKITDAQKKMLQDTGNLGLVKDLVNKETGELYNAWVAYTNLLIL